MSRISEMQSFVTPDGTRWGVQVEVPGASNALVVFHHPDGRTSRKDRYAWINWHGPEASNVRANLTPAMVLGTLDAAAMAALFRRSMLIGSGRGPAIIAA